MVQYRNNQFESAEVKRVIEIKIIDANHKTDINIPNQPFVRI